MKTALPSLKNYLCGLALVGVSVALMPTSANAQYGSFRTANQPLSFGLIGTNGEASRYELVISIPQNNGVINVNTNLSRRYDIAATNGNINPPAGSSVGKTNSTSLVSRLGTPIITNIIEYVFPTEGPSNSTILITNKSTNLEVPFAIFLNDGGRIKGTLERTVQPGGMYTNFNFEGGATHQGKIGFGGTEYDYGMPVMPMP
jgi:hypothetical protein